MKPNGQQESDQLELLSVGGEGIKPLVQAESTVQGSGEVTDLEKSEIGTELSNADKLGGSESGTGGTDPTSNGTSSDKLAHGAGKGKNPEGKEDNKVGSGAGDDDSSEGEGKDKGSGGGSGKGKDGRKQSARKASKTSAIAKGAPDGLNNGVTSNTSAGGKGDSGAADGGISNKDENGEDANNASGAGKEATKPKAGESKLSRLDVFKKTMVALKQVFEPLLRVRMSLLNILALALEDEGVKAALSTWAQKKKADLPDWFIACGERGKK